MSKKRKMLIGILVVIAIIVTIISWYLQRPLFGALPTGERLKRVEASPNYQNGSFNNLEYTPQMAEGHSMLDVLYNFIFAKGVNTRPSQPLKTIKTDLKNLDISIDQLIWLGHSSYLFIIDKKVYLVDPVFTHNASPVPGFNTSFEYNNNYTVHDLPQIDYLIISHDHYDHLDYETIVELKDKVSQVICGLAVGAHFEKWGYNPQIITELDWYDSHVLNDTTVITATPARHFSGRLFKRNTSLFCSFVLKTPQHNIFIGGDSGYGQHFKTIGEKYGPFDWAILENGQYNEAWHNIHTLPEELPKVIEDIQVSKVIPVHSAKFKLALHEWTEPLERAYQLQLENSQIILPPIGEIVKLTDTNFNYAPWWRNE